MKTDNTIQTKEKGRVLTTIGLIVMLLLSLTQLIPELSLAGISVFVGVALFFIVEAIAKTPKAQSGLRFKSFVSDVKKPGVVIWALLPIVTAIVPLMLGDLLMNNGYSAHVIERAGAMLTYENIPMLAFQVIILAFGEEIAWRGFFVGKSVKWLPFWLCAVVSSLLFAIGHIASGDILLVLFDIGFVFIDSMIFAIIYKKSGNCLVSTASHIIGNVVGLVACFVVI